MKIKNKKETIMLDIVGHAAITLIGLCIEMNRDDFSTFAEFAGHVNSISIRVYSGGWREGKEADIWEDIDLSGDLGAVLTRIDVVKAKILNLRMRKYESKSQD